MHQMQKTEYSSTEMLEVSRFFMLILKFFPHHLFLGQTFGMSHLIMKTFGAGFRVFGSKNTNKLSISWNKL